MKICITTENNAGLDSKVYGHFGSAPYFIVYDTQDGNFTVIDNNDKAHVHGACNPLMAFKENPIDVLITGGIGARALMKLNNSGIKAFRANTKDSISQIIDNFKSNKLTEISYNDACIHNH